MLDIWRFEIAARRFEMAVRRRQYEEQGVQDDSRLHFRFNELKLKIKII
jgi:hypothetical protein